MEVRKYMIASIVLLLIKVLFSLDDISAKSIIMLDKLEKSLYQKQIQKVEDFFRKEIRTLMRKSNFIDDIAIDEHFNIHLYRNEEFSPKRIKEIFDTNTEEQIRTLLGEKAIYIIKQANKQFNDKTLVLPVEIDKSGLSNGEKQIFSNIDHIFHCRHLGVFVDDRVCKHSDDIQKKQ